MEHPPIPPKKRKRSSQTDHGPESAFSDSSDGPDTTKIISLSWALHFPTLHPFAKDLQWAIEATEISQCEPSARAVRAVLLT